MLQGGHDFVMKRSDIFVQVKESILAGRDSRTMDMLKTCPEVVGEKDGKNVMYYREIPSHSHNTLLFLLSQTSLLHLVARVGIAELVEPLIAAGGDINGRNDAGLTPLHFAFMYGRKKCALTLASLVRKHLPFLLRYFQ